MRTIVLSRITPALFYVSEFLCALVLRWPLKVWGPPSLLAYRPIFASWWRYAWMKTRRRGLNSTWLCQFWKKCRTNELPSCAWTSHPSWWCGAYQYCLKLLCCCVQGHCGSCFWDNTAAAFFHFQSDVTLFSSFLIHYFHCILDEFSQK